MSTGIAGDPLRKSEDLARRARDLEGYDAISHLRQAQDYGRILGLVEGTPTSFADLGCGTGVMLQMARERWPGLEYCFGVDGARGRVEAARARLGDRDDVQEGDLRSLESLDRDFDVITMTSVLHWLFPDEPVVFQWVAQHLAPSGVFLLTTHHPVLRGNARLGGEDLVVREALMRLGVEAGGLAKLPGISTRTRTAGAIRKLLSDAFDVEMVDVREEPMRVRSAEEHVEFHIATFGSYFSRLAPGREYEFFQALGQAAHVRMQEQGQVYEITVRSWRCGVR